MKKIGVLRANALGDFIVSLPALDALRKAYPSAEIVLLGRQPHKELLEGRDSSVDRVIPIPSHVQFDRPMEETAEISELIRSLREEDFDLIVQLHGGGRYSNAFVKRLNPKMSLGAKTPEAEDLDMTVAYNLYQHEVLRQLEILDALDISANSLSPRLNSTYVDLKRGKDLLKNFDVGEKIVLLNPGAKDPRRRWPKEKFMEVAGKYYHDGYDILVNTGPDEKDLSTFFRERAPFCHVISPSLKDLIGVILHSDFVITNDTGTMHLALAFRRPTISLFWYRNLIQYAPLDSENSRVLVSWNSHCQVCGKNCSVDACEHEASLISDIELQSVFNSIDEMTKRSDYAGGKNRSRSFDRRTFGQDLYS